MNRFDYAIKRTFDILLSFVGLVLFFPLVLLCILIARFDTNDTGVFSQKRIGRNGKSFDVYKIRTMRSIKSKNNITITVADDARITSSGQLMRRYKLDELPQLLNVLKGEMSFVGPRPDVPGYADLLKGDMRRVLLLRPGITGPASIKYREEEKILAAEHDPKKFNDTIVFPDKVKINLNYIDNYTFMKDVKYILMTLKLIPIPNDLSYNECSHS